MSLSREEALSFFMAPERGVLRGSGSTAVVMEQGDCREVLRQWPQGLFDAIVTDPGVGDSGGRDGWVKGVPGGVFWQEMLRVVKPGAHCAVFSGRKTDHRLLTHAEEAGWEVRDKLLWLYPKGMPMSLDVGQGVAKKMGEEAVPYFRSIGAMTDAQRRQFEADQASNPWWGWGTELRPSWEPISILRAPLAESSVAANVLEHGTGAMNIDAVRIDSGERDAIATHIPEGQGAAHGLALQKDQAVVGTTTLGRWPANAILDHHPDCDQDCHPDCPVGMLDQMGTGRQPPSTFFWCPKTSKSERDLGGPNSHKVVRPVRLMEWLLRALVPPGGWVLDPFAGTGSTGLAAVRLALGGFVGVEEDQEWCRLAHERIARAGELS